MSYVAADMHACGVCEATSNKNVDVVVHSRCYKDKAIDVAGTGVYCDLASTTKTLGKQRSE